MILNGFCKCIDSALMGGSTPSTAFDAAVCLDNVDTLNICVKDFG